MIEHREIIRQNLAPLHFVYENYVDGKPYPNLADPFTGITDQTHLAYTWPYASRCGIEDHCRTFNYPLNQYSIDADWPISSWFPVDIARWDFGADYLSLLSDKVKHHLRDNRIKLLFYCHEPWLINDQRRHLESLFTKHKLSKDAFMAVSENYLALHIFGNFVFYSESENQAYTKFKDTSPAVVESAVKDFYCAGSVNEQWQMAAITHLHQTNILANSHWSIGFRTQYNRGENHGFEVDKLAGLTHKIQHLSDHGPWESSPLSQTRMHEKSTSAIHIIFADRFVCDGGYLNQELFQSMAMGRPFVFVGPAECLGLLKKIGYRVFDNIIDNSYDVIHDPLKRWLQIRNTVAEIKSQGAQEVLRRCQSDIEHNLKEFHEIKDDKLRFVESALSLGRTNE